MYCTVKCLDTCFFVSFKKYISKYYSMNTNSKSDTDTDTDTDSIIHAIRREWIHRTKKHTKSGNPSTETLCKLYKKLMMDCFEKDQRECRNLFDNMIETCYEE